MGSAAFSTASPEQRIRALFDPDCSPVLRWSGNLLWGRGTIAGRPALSAASDPARFRGAMGIEETRALQDLMDQAIREDSAAVLLLDSAGARVDQGLSALGGFRRLFASALAADAHGVNMVALLGRWCFGGASLLAALCGRRSYLQHTLLATSGPTIIEAAEGKSNFDAADHGAVESLLSSSARVARHAQDEIRDDSLEAARATVARWVMEKRRGPDLPLVQQDLARRLGESTDSPDVGEASGGQRLMALLPPGYLPSVNGHLFRALPAPASSKAAFIGTLAGHPLDAADCLVLAQWLGEIPQSHPGSPVVLLLDAAGHAAAVRDERVLLADYLVHLSRVIFRLSHGGNRVVLWIAGAASGASYVAFAAPAERVSALPGARIAILPPASAQQILGDLPQEAAGQQAWFDAGVADALLDERLYPAPE